MIRIVFKNIDKSDLVRKAVIERVESLVEKFPDLKKARINVTLEMLNSPLKPGPDLFCVNIQCNSGRYRGIQIKKSAKSLYAALADVNEHLLERINRFGDRIRNKDRKESRKFTTQMNP